MQLPDTHVHLDDPRFAHDIDAVLARAHEAGIGPILAVGSDLESSRKAVCIAHRHPSVFAAIGLHPHEADRFREEAPALEQLLDEDKVVAIGEVGLDLYRGGAPREQQMDAFVTQLKWAEQRRVPVSVHSRGAEADVLRCLESVDVVPVLHCFSGDIDRARDAVDGGCYLSFAGNVTFPKASDLREVVRVVPDDRLLVETDAPVLAPQPRRGRRNEPAYLTMIVDTLAETRQVSVEALSATLGANAARVFGWEPV